MKHYLLLPNHEKLDIRTLPLDFANTCDWHASEHPTELLNSYADLLAWSNQHELLTENEAQRLIDRAESDPLAAERVLKQAIELREALYRIFSAISAGSSPRADDMDLLNANLSKSLDHIQLVQNGSAFGFQLTSSTEQPEQVLWPVAFAAAELLASAELRQVKECEDDRGCGVLFFDTSKNRTRRWCSMRSCGNRAKVRRHRQQKQA